MMTRALSVQPGVRAAGPGQRAVSLARRCTLLAFAACCPVAVRKTHAAARLGLSPPHICANTWNNCQNFAFPVGANLLFGFEFSGHW